MKMKRCKICDNLVPEYEFDEYEETCLDCYFVDDIDMDFDESNDLD